MRRHNSEISCQDANLVFLRGGKLKFGAAAIKHKKGIVLARRTKMLSIVFLIYAEELVYY